MPQKYQSYQKKEFVRPYKIHPVWRGIGFLMMVLVPIMAGAAAVVVTEIGMSWPFMGELRGTMRLPDIMYTLPVIRDFAYWVSSIPNMRAILLFFVLLLIVFSGIMSLLYAMIYRVVGPPKYTSLDAPAEKVKVKRYTR